MEIRTAAWKQFDFMNGTKISRDEINMDDAEEN